MSKAILSLVIGGVLVAAGYLVLSSGRNAGELPEATLQSEGAESSGEKKMAFSEFLKQGGSYKCMVHQNVNNMDSSGVVYINDNMFRGEYATVVEDVEINSNFIVRDSYTYSWNSVMPNAGFKIKMNTVQGANTSPAAAGSYSFNAEQIRDYNCESWVSDSAMFTLPAGVTFREVIGN